LRRGFGGVRNNTDRLVLELGDVQSDAFGDLGGDLTKEKEDDGILEGERGGGVLDGDVPSDGV